MQQVTPSLKIDDGTGCALWVADRPGGGFIVRQARATIRASADEARELARYILGALGD